MTAPVTAAIRANYAAVATTYDGKWADVLAVHARAVANRLDLANARRVAELGCGPGRLLSHLERLAPQARVIGADLTEAMLRQAPARFARVVGDAQALPFAEDSLLPADLRAKCLAAAEQELAELEPEASTESGTILYTTARWANCRGGVGR